jgi:hypothetical protein
MFRKPSRQFVGQMPFEASGIWQPQQVFDGRIWMRAEPSFIVRTGNADFFLNS